MALRMKLQKFTPPRSGCGSSLQMEVNLRISALNERALRNINFCKNRIDMFFVDVPCQDPYSAKTQLVLQCQVVVLPWIGPNLHLEGQERKHPACSFVSIVNLEPCRTVSHPPHLLATGLEREPFPD